MAHFWILLVGAYLFNSVFSFGCPQYDFIDPFIGSSGIGFGYGSISPAAQGPFGALRAGIDTTSTPLDVSYRHFSGYNHYDTHIRSFSQTRLVGAGVNDLGNIGIMPYCGDIDSQSWDMTKFEQMWWSPFIHSRTTASPGMFSTYIQPCDTTVDIVAGLKSHSASYLFRKTPLNASNWFLSVDVCHSVLPNWEMEGSCLNASLSISPPSDPTPYSDSKDGVIEGSVVFHGSLSGRSSFNLNAENKGGILIYFALRFTSLPSLPPTPGDNRDEVGGERDVFPSRWRMWDGEEGVSDEWSDDDEALDVWSESGALGVFLDFSTLFSSSSSTSSSSDSLISSDLQMGIGISFVSKERAILNLEEEIYQIDHQIPSLSPELSPELPISPPLSTHNSLNHHIKQRWCDYLSSILLPSPHPDLTDDMQISVYSALYRTGMSPTSYQEGEEGAYMGMDGVEHSMNTGGSDDVDHNKNKNNNKVYLSDLSLWDTHRTLHSLHHIISPSISTSLFTSLYLMNDQGGSLPKWALGNVYTNCMIGNSANSVILEMILKPSPSSSSTSPSLSSLVTLWTSMKNQAFWGNATHGNRPYLSSYFTQDEVDFQMDKSTATPHSLPPIWMEEMGGEADGDFDGTCDEECVGVGFIPQNLDDNSGSLTLTFAFDDAVIGRIALYILDACEENGEEDGCGGIGGVIDQEEVNFWMNSSRKWEKMWSDSHELLCPLMVQTSEKLIPNVGDMTRREDENEGDGDQIDKKRTSMIVQMCPLSNGSISTFHQFTEGNIRQWSWFVPHDIPQLVSKFQQSSSSSFTFKLNEFMQDSVGFHEKWGNFMPNTAFWMVILHTSYILTHYQSFIIIFAILGK